MKKIMKKALSLALALVMMLSLAPVTTQASMSMTGDVLDVEGGTNTVWFDGEEKYAYTWTPEIGGIYTFTFNETDWVCSILGPSTADYGSFNNNTGVFTHEFTAGIEYTIEVLNTSWSQDDINFTVVQGEVEQPAVTGDGSENNPYDITEAKEMDGLGYGATAYYMITGLNAGGAYTIYVNGSSMNDAYSVNGTDAMYGSASVNVNAYQSGVVIFSITNNNLANGGSYTFNWEEVVVEPEEPEEAPLGSMDKKDTLVLDTKLTANPTGDYVIYYYTYTASEAGILSVTMYDDECPNGWILSISTETSDDWSRDVYTESAYATDDDPESVSQNPATYAIEANETVSVWVTTSSWGAGTVVLEATFEETETPVVKPEGGVTFTEKEENAALSSEVLSVGEKEYETSLYEYTLYAFAPTQTGKYTFTVENGVIGLASKTGMWVDEDLTEVASASFTWECTDAKENADDNGQSIWVAVKTNDGTANITVEREELVIKEIPQTVYPASADAYVFAGDASAIEYVDVQGTTTDTAVLGDDGFYHLNDKTGPILLVNLDDSVFTFVTDETFGKLPVATYDTNGEVVSTVVYGEYVEACLANASSVKHPVYDDVLLYPLTEGLMEVYKTYGAQQGWYNTSMGGYVIGQFNGKYNAEDIWMFACMYVPNAEDGTIEVPPVAIKPDAIVDEETGKVTGYEPVKEEAVKAAIDKAVAENRDLVVETTADGVVMTFAAEDLKDAKAVALNIEVALKNDVKDETVAKNDKITDKNFVLKVEFSHEGNLPTTATITIPVSADFAGKTLYYYEILTDGTLKFVCDAPVDANGVASVAQDHCSDYVLLTERVDAVEPETTPDNSTTGTADPETSTTPNDAPTTSSPKTGDDTNIALWVAVLGLGVVAIAGSVVMRKREF